VPGSTDHYDPDDVRDLERFRADLARAWPHIRAFHVRVPAESHAEQARIADAARAWNRANGRPITSTLLGYDSMRVVREYGEHGPGIVEVDGLYVEWAFPRSEGPEVLDLMTAFSEAIGPYAWPDRPAVRLEAKGTDA
jgi:hypothetical protein